MEDMAKKLFVEWALPLGYSQMKIIVAGAPFLVQKTGKGVMAKPIKRRGR